MTSHILHTRAKAGGRRAPVHELRQAEENQMRRFDKAFVSGAYR